jgi:hypothetical protein
MFKQKTAVILMIIVAVILVAGISMLLFRKQTMQIGGETVQLKSSWKKPATDPKEKPADNKA